MDDDGSSWVVPHPDVRLYFNWSLGRGAGNRPGRDVAANRRADPAAAGRH